MGDKIYIAERQYDILKCLETRIDAMSLKQIGEEIDCSYKTVQNELTKLRQDLPEGWSIPTEKATGIYLIQPLSETVASRFSHDENDALFDLIELLLTNRSYSLDALCDDMYMSRGAVLKLMASAETFIQSFFLKMKRNPYRITGSEGPKRLLLFEINLSRAGISNHYIMRLPYSNLQPASDYLQRHHGICLTNYGFNVFYNMLNIFTSRMDDGFFADELPFRASIYDEPLFIDMQGFFDYLEELVNVPFSMQERSYIYLNILYTEFQFTIVQADNRIEQLQAHRDYHAFTAFIQFLEDRLTISLWDDEELIFDIFNLYEISRLRSVTPELQYIPGESILRSARNNVRQIYKYVHDLCEEWSKKAGGFVFNESNLITLTILLNQHISKSEVLKINMLLLTSRLFFVKDTSGILKTHFQGKAHVTTMAVSDVTREADIPDETDMIITDSPQVINTTNIKMVLISHSISDKNIRHISQAIQTLADQKKERFLAQLVPGT